MTKTPGGYIKDELEKREWTQTQLAQIIDRPLQVVNEIVLGKRSISPDTAAALGAAFGTGAEIWLQREAEFQLAKSDIDTTAVERRARLYELAPIKEMEKRQWILPTKTSEALEKELKRFFDVESLDEEPKIGAATRKSDADDPLTPSQRAWCFRVRQLARSFGVGKFDRDALATCKKELRKLAAYPKEGFKVPDLLSKFGIRFVVVEPLPGTRVDGVALWLDSESPVIGMSARYDRIDSFWFTLFHEVSHIDHGDDAPLDADLTDQMEGVTVVRAQMERRANEEAAHALVEKKELESFILRVGPLYSKERIIKFAHRIKMHPGIIVGQLQRRHEIGYYANREMLSKIREYVISTSVTDGWGHTLDLRSFT